MLNEEYIPILYLVASRLSVDQDWSLAILDSITLRLLLNVYRARRDDTSSDDLLAIEAGMNVIRSTAAETADKSALAYLLARAERLDEALHWIDLAIKESIENVDYYRFRGNVLERMDRLDEAESAIEQACVLTPDHVALQEDRKRIKDTLVARLRLRRDRQKDVDVDLALKAAMDIVRRCPNEEGDQVALAHLLARAGQLPDALRWMDGVIKGNTNNAEYYRFRASILERMGHLNEAKSAIEQACMLAPDHVALQEDRKRIRDTLIAQLRLRRDNQGDVDQALEVAMEIVRRCPNEEGDQVALAHLLARAGQLPDALHWMDGVIKGNTNNAEYYQFRASILERVGHLNEAESAIEQACALAPDHVALQEDRKRIKGTLVARLRLRRDRQKDVDVDLALKAAMDIVRHCPNEEGDQVALAHLLARAGQLPDALHWMDGVIKGNTNNAEYYRFRANMLEQMKNYRIAYRAIKDAIATDPKSREIRQDAHRILKKLIVNIFA